MLETGEFLMKIAIITGASSGMGREGNPDSWRIAFRDFRGLADCPPDGPDAGAGTDAADPGAVFRYRSDGCIQRGRRWKTKLAARKPNVKILVNASGCGKIKERSGTCRLTMKREW